MWELQVLKALDLPSVEDTGEDEGIRNEDVSCGHTNINTHNNKNYWLIYICAGARALKMGKDVTPEVVNKVVGTEGQFPHACCVGHGPSKPHHIDTQQNR